jgi:pSer/pThr/pTyr-binding forkhead associated (FHA) protein
MTPIQPSAPPQLPRAFVILDGERTISLREPVLNLGRRLDNQIIVDDPRVSRSHAQLRLRFGHYVVYDLGSTGGTFVNGKRIEECVLRPGDVISLGGVPVIYGEDGDWPAVEASVAHSTMPLLPPDRQPLAPDRR